MILEVTVSYCKTGLENHEFCLWVVAEPLAVEDRQRALQRAVPDFDRYFADQSIEIVGARDWYLQDGTFDLDRVIGGWNEKLALASARGYAGARVTGDAAWLEKKDRRDLCEYEDSLNRAVAISVWRSYAPTRSPGAELLKSWMWCEHISLRQPSGPGAGTLSKTAGHRQAKAEIKRLSEELEQRVAERTSRLWCSAVWTRLFQRVHPDDQAMTSTKLEGARREKSESKRITEPGKNGC